MLTLMATTPLYERSSMADKVLRNAKIRATGSKQLSTYKIVAMEEYLVELRRHLPAL